MSYSPEPDSHIWGKAKVVLDLLIMQLEKN